MEYCMAAASSPFAPPNCSSNIFPKRGSGSSTRTVYMSFLTWWYMGWPLMRLAALRDRGATKAYRHSSYFDRLRRGEQDKDNGGDAFCSTYSPDSSPLRRY